MKKYLNSDNLRYTLANLSQLTFEVTDACNLRCTYCGYGELYDDYDQREGKTLSIEKAISLIDYLNQYWQSELNVSVGKRVTIGFYGGEPLLNMKFIKAIVNHVSNLQNPYRNFTFSMTTNAVLLDKYMDYLIEHDFKLVISLDGNKENTSYRVDKHGKSAYDTIVENAELIRKTNPTYFENRVNFNAVLHNKNSVEEIYKYFKDKYNKIPFIGELNSVGIREDKYQDFLNTYQNKQESLEQSENYEEIEREMFMRVGNYRSAGVFLRQYSGFMYHDYTDLLFDSDTFKQERLPTGTCVPFSKKMYVTVNGKLLPCERIGHQHALGEITDTEINLDLEKIAQQYNAYYAKLEKQCSHCKNTKACRQCIFNLEDLDKKPICYGYMNEKDFEDYANAQLEFLQRNPDAYRKLMEVIVR